MLQNRLIAARLPSRQYLSGQHEAIIDPDFGKSFRPGSAANRRSRSLGIGVEEPSLLTGLIFDEKASLLPATRQEGKRYRITSPPF